MKLKNKYSKQNIYSNQKFEDQIWYNQQIMTFLIFTQLSKNVFCPNTFLKTKPNFSFTGKCFPLTNFSNGKQTQESLESDFLETTFRKTNTAKGKTLSWKPSQIFLWPKSVFHWPESIFRWLESVFCWPTFLIANKHRKV